MRTLGEIRKILKEQRELLAEKYGIAVVGIFGSHLRGESKSDSDLDLLADILRPISLLELVGAELYLSETLGIKVDLVPKRSLRKELKEGILKEAIVP
jgi:predicted nucleotidyltransferase